MDQVAVNPHSVVIAGSDDRHPAQQFEQVPVIHSGRSIAWIVSVVFGVLILIPSMLGFMMKFRELVALTGEIGEGGFAITPVINYLLASAGFFLMLLWAGINGMFRDLERPKYWMLENERELDRHV
jgi:hypothetical protein